MPLDPWLIGFIVVGLIFFLVLLWGMFHAATLEPPPSPQYAVHPLQTSIISGYMRIAPVSEIVRDLERAGWSQDNIQDWLGERGLA